MRNAFILICLSSFALAKADDIELVGSATGHFNNNSTSILGLSYLGSTFDVFTSDGFYALGNNASNLNLDNLGSFTLSSAADNYSGDTFTLLVTFTDPTGIQGSNSVTYTASLIGRVTKNDQGGVQIFFSNQTANFTFTDGGTSGSFSLTVNPVSITPGHVDPATGYGYGQATSVPGPASLLTMVAGLGGAVLRRRRK